MILFYIIYLVEQPSIWEKYKIIILTLSLILIIIYFCLYYYKKSTGKGIDSMILFYISI